MWRSTRPLAVVASMLGWFGTQSPSHADFLHDMGQAVGQAVHDTGQAVGQAVHDTGQAAGKAAEDTGLAPVARNVGNTLDKANNDFHDQTDRSWEDLNRFLKEGEKWICNVMTAGAYEQGNASCTISGGYGVGSDGEHKTPYVFNPNTPDDKIPITEDHLTLPKVDELAGMQRLLGIPPELEAAVG